MSTENQERNANRFLNFTGYLTIAAVGAAAVLDIPSFWGRWGAVALLLAFAFLLTRTPDVPDPEKRWQSWIVLGLQTVTVIGLLLVQPGSSIFPILFFILSTTAMQANSLRAGFAWIVLFALITALSFGSAYGWDMGLRLTGPFFGGYLFFGITIYSLVRARQAQRQAERANERLEAANEALKDYAARAENMAVMDERARMAREMHDTVGHRLTVAAVQLDAAQRLIPQDPARAAQMTGTVREQVREALRELRSTVARMREPLEADMQLGPALERLVASFSSATGLEVALSLPEELPELPLLYRQSLFRAAQEGLTNVQRHAQASQAWIEVSLPGDEICLSISDNGRGYAPENDSESEQAEGLGDSQTGFGLLGMRERAAQIGGRLTLGERPGGGACLEIHLPIPQEVSHA